MRRAATKILGVGLLVFALLDFGPPARASAFYVVRHDRWTEANERGFGEFIAELGTSGCRTVDSCLHDAANPFRASDPAGATFRSDCADLPYVLRFYYAWKEGLPFSYVSDVAPRGRTRDIRYTARGNRVAARRDVDTGSDAMRMLATLSDAVSSATYRIHPDLEEPYEADFYSPALKPGSIRPGTVIYDPNGHVAIVFRIEPDGRIRYIDAHPDNSLTRGTYDLRFVRASPGMGAGFKNWRPLRLAGRHAKLSPNRAIADYSDEQFFGNGARPVEDGSWKSGVFRLKGTELDYYDYVRAKLAGGNLSFDPVAEISDMVQSNCADLHYRADAVTDALAAGLADRPEPDRLPPNIYGSEGMWEAYSTPSRDARLKTAFKEVRDQAARFVALWRAQDSRLTYRGDDLVGDLLAAYDRAAGSCRIEYTRSDGTSVVFGYEDARRRLFAMSFDPYQCVERRWGAVSPEELASCRDGAVKRAWYEAEQGLRNQLDRTYQVEMDWSLGELPGKGVATPPDTDARGFLVTQKEKPDTRVSGIRFP